MSAGVVLASEAMRAKIADQRRLSTPLRDYAVFRSTRNGMEWRSRGGATTRWSTAHSTGSALARGLLSHAQPRVSSSGPSAHGSSTVAHLWAGGAGSSGSSLGLSPSLPRRARGATGPRPGLPATQAARAGARGGGCSGASESSSEASSGRGQRCPQGRPCAGPPFHPPPRWSSRSATASSASQPSVGRPYAITRCGVHSRARSGCKTCSPGPSLHLVGVRVRLRLRLKGGVGGRA